MKKQKQPNYILENHKLKNDLKKAKNDLENWKTLYGQTAQSNELLKRQHRAQLIENDRLNRQINQLREQIESQLKMITEMKEEFDI